jgi:tetratricopeptide (TPR) repeat protein
MGDEDRAQLAAMLGQACYLQGRYEEAEHFALSSLKINTNDIARVALARGVCAKVHARLSRLAEGERMAREAVALLEATDLLISRADALMDLVEVLRLAGRPDEAGPVVEEALRLSERKGNIVAVERARALQAELAAESSQLS